MTLVPYAGPPLTAGNEIDKLASNVGLGGAGPGGVHWRSDCDQGMYLGEACAIAVLQDMRRTWNESFVGFQFRKFDGTVVTIEIGIERDGGGPAGRPATAQASPKRRVSQNGGATCRVRLDEQLATDQLQTFLHAGQAESYAAIRLIDVEASTFITNGEIDGVPGSAKLHIETPDLAVSHRVVQGLLEDPEEAERDVSRDAARNVLAAEINLGAFLVRQLFAETLHRGHDAQVQQPRRVQLV